MSYRSDQVRRNWAENVELRPRRLYSPSSVDEVVELVREADRLGRHVRAMGSAWSFTDVMKTDDFLIDMTAIQGVLALTRGREAWGHSMPGLGGLPGATGAARSSVLPTALAERVLDAPTRRFAHVLAGTKIRALYTALDTPANDRPLDGVAAGARDAWALPTMGGASGQALIGAISTGTHGGDFDLPPIADMVRAIELVAPDGDRYWIEGGGARAITERARVERALAGQIAPEHIVCDDDWLDALLVSVGCLGVIWSAVIEVREQFGLSQLVRTDLTSWRELRGQLLSGRLFDDPAGLPAWLALHPMSFTDPADPTRAYAVGRRLPRGVGFFLNPYRIGDDYTAPFELSDRHVRVTTHAEADVYARPPARAAAPGQAGLIGPLTAIYEAGDLPFTRGIVDALMTALRPDTAAGAPYFPSWSVLDTTSTDDRGLPIMSVELVITTHEHRHVAALDAMLAAFDELVRAGQAAGRGIKFAGAMAVRFTRATAAILGMQAPTTTEPERFCHIEVIALREGSLLGPGGAPEDLEGDSEAFVRAFEAAARSVGGRLHWGQWSLTGARDPLDYPRFPTWRAIRDRLTAGGRHRAFDNAFAVRFGLSAPAPGWHVVAGLLPSSPRVVADEPVAVSDPSVITNPVTGLLEVFAASPDGLVCRSHQLASAGWSDWEVIGPAAAQVFEGRVAAVAAETDLYLFARARDGALYQTSTVARTRTDAWVEATWGPFTGHRCVGSPAAVLGVAGGRPSPCVHVRCEDGRLRFVRLATAFARRGHFGDWENSPALPPGMTADGDPVAAVDGSGRTHLVIRAGGTVWHLGEAHAGDGFVGGAWRSLGGELRSDPALIAHPAGGLELIGVGTDQRLWQRRQDSSGTWSAWTQVEAAPFTVAGNRTPSARRSALGLVVAAVDQQDVVRMLTEVAGGLEVTTLRTRATSAPAIGLDSSGGVEVVVRVAGDRLEHRGERARGDYWERIGGPARELIAGGDQLYAVSSDGAGVWRFDGEPDRWRWIGGSGSQFVADDHHLFGLADGGDAILRFDHMPGRWTVIGGEAAVLVAGGDHLLKIDPVTAIVSRWSRSSAAPVASSWRRIGGPFAQVVASRRGIFAITPSRDATLEWLPSVGEWRRIGGPMRELIAGPAHVYGVTEDGGVSIYGRSPGAWLSIGGPGATFAATERTLYGLTPDLQRVMEFVGDGRWMPVAGPSTHLLAGGATLYRTDRDGYTYRL